MVVVCRCLWKCVSYVSSTQILITIINNFISKCIKITTEMHFSVIISILTNNNIKLYCTQNAKCIIVKNCTMIWFMGPSALNLQKASNISSYPYSFYYVLIVCIMMHRKNKSFHIYINHNQLVCISTYKPKNELIYQKSTVDY